MECAAPAERVRRRAELGVGMPGATEELDTDRPVNRSARGEPEALEARRRRLVHYDPRDDVAVGELDLGVDVLYPSEVVEHQWSAG